MTKDLEGMKIELREIVNQTCLCYIYSQIDDLLIDAMAQETKENSDRLKELKKFVSDRWEECFNVVCVADNGGVQIKLIPEEKE